MISERDYMRDNFSVNKIKSKFETWSAVKIILLANIFCFVLQNIFVSETYHNRDEFFTYFMAMQPQAVLEKGKIWQLFTSMFVHSDFLHIFFNMLVLWMFGPPVEKLIGKRNFFYLFFFAGIFSSIIYLLFNYSSVALCLGASGALCGIIVADAIFYPKMQVGVFFIINMPIRRFVCYFAIISFILSILQFLKITDGWKIAHSAHLGGMIGGLIWIKLKQNKISFNNILVNLKAKINQRRWRRIDKNIKIDNKEIDRILEKISKYGIKNLTIQEREVLSKARENLNRH